MLRIPNDTPVAVVADGASPRLLTPASAHPAEAIAALTRLASAPSGSSGNASTVAALDLVARQLPATPGRARIVVLTTAAPAPGGTEANALVDRFVAAGVVLAVVGTGQAADLAERRGRYRRDGDHGASRPTPPPRTTA